MSTRAYSSLKPSKQRKQPPLKRQPKKLNKPFFLIRELQRRNHLTHGVQVRFCWFTTTLTPLPAPKQKKKEQQKVAARRVSATGPPAHAYADNHARALSSTQMFSKKQIYCSKQNLVLYPNKPPKFHAAAPPSPAHQMIQIEEDRRVAVLREWDVSSSLVSHLRLT